MQIVHILCLSFTSFCPAILCPWTRCGIPRGTGQRQESDRFVCLATDFSVLWWPFLPVSFEQPSQKPLYQKQRGLYSTVMARFASPIFHPKISILEIGWKIRCEATQPVSPLWEKWQVVVLRTMITSWQPFGICIMDPRRCRPRCPSTAAATTISTTSKLRPHHLGWQWKVPWLYCHQSHWRAQEKQSAGVNWRWRRTWIRTCHCFCFVCFICHFALQCLWHLLFLFPMYAFIFQAIFRCP